MKKNITNSLWLLLSLISFLVAFIFLTALKESNYQTIVAFTIGFLGLGITAFVVWVSITINHFYKKAESLEQEIKELKEKSE